MKTSGFQTFLVFTPRQASGNSLIKAGDTLEYFLEGFPSVSRKQAIELIERAQQRVAGTK